MNSILILGGYGNFGARIAAALVKKNIAIVIAGRNLEMAETLKKRLVETHNAALIQIAIFDAQQSLAEQLVTLKPCVVINTIGPFQSADYTIPQTCIDHGVHYIDLADARDFVNGITCLNASAQEKNVLVVSGASTVPGLSSAVLDYYKSEFSSIDSLRYGISPGQKAPRGLATTQSILSYLGKALKPWGRTPEMRYGWQDIYRQPYPELGKRWMANCDIPDLDLFPERYGIQSIQFSAGMESSLLHLGMWLVSWLVRLGAPIDLSRHAQRLLALSHYFDWLGTPDGGMHMIITGKNQAGLSQQRQWFIIAKAGDGPQIPCIPAIILAKKLVNHELSLVGAYPCLGLITLDEYLSELKGFSIRCVESGSNHLS